MENIMVFLDEVFSIERDAIKAKSAFNVEVFNKKFEELLEFSNSESIRFGMSRMDSSSKNPLDLFPEFRNVQETEFHQRHIFKISSYQHPKYMELFACYVSKQNPKPNIFFYSNCFLVGQLEGQFKFISRYVFVDEKKDDSHWRFTGGDRELTFQKLGQATEILRLIEPKDDQNSMEDYLKDH